jgi:hypothetical protein
VLWRQRGLFGSLADTEHGAAPEFGGIGQSGGAGNARDAHVVLAGVHDAGRRARVRQAGLLVHRQRVQLGPHQNGWPWTVPADTHHAVRADPRGDLEPGAGQAAGEPRSGPRLPAGQFRVVVQLLVQSDCGGQRLVEPIVGVPHVDPPGRSSSGLRCTCQLPDAAYTIFNDRGGQVRPAMRLVK